MSQTKTQKVERIVHAPFRKVVAFDMLFMLLGGLVGTGLMGAFLLS